MKFDIRDKNQLKNLKNAANSPQGRIIHAYLLNRLEDLSFDKIDTSRSHTEIGMQFSAMKEARELLEAVISYITPIKGD